jgi:hypothetical protein
VCRPRVQLPYRKLYRRESKIGPKRPEEGMFVRTLQCLAAQQQKQQCGPVKEANLMPVPSPQQIQYLNAFEGKAG